MSRPGHDPFGENTEEDRRAKLTVLGGDFNVTSTDGELLQLAVDTLGNLPAHRVRERPHQFNMRLVLTTLRSSWPKRSEPPKPRLQAGSDLLCATIDAGNFAALNLAASSGLVCLSRKMLDQPYFARTDLLELAFLTLASRGQGLVPLHAACIGLNGAGLLLMGPSGAGKSTLALQALASGMELLSEDSAFVVPESLLVTGVSNFLHVKPESLAWLLKSPLRECAERAPIIKRRSGARKLEIDLRGMRNGIVCTPLRLAATVILLRRSTGNQPALRRLDRSRFLAHLRREQPYAAGLAEWQEFERRAVEKPAFELRQAQHPRFAIECLKELLSTC